MSDAIHEWDGAYVLGALSPEDRHRFEAHLAGCSACAKSVRELAGLPGILGRLDPSEATAMRDLPDDRGLRDGVHAADRVAGIARRVRRRRVRVRLLAGLVLVGVLAVGAAIGVGTAASPPATTAASTHELQPVGGSHLFAELRVTPVGWGTRFDWSCDYRRLAGETESAAAPVSYSLVVRTDTGATSTVATWSSDGGEARDLVGATAIPADTITGAEIQVTGSGAALAETSF